VSEAADKGAFALRPLGRTGLNVSEIGLGAAPLGNLYRPMADEDAGELTDTALSLGFTYVDTAPFYGFGLSERRVGAEVTKTDGVVVSTKVGRLLEPDSSVIDDRERFGFRSAMPYRPVFDYRREAILRSYEDSLRRLGDTAIDVLLVHDIGRRTHGADHAHYRHQLVDEGGLDALAELRDSGEIAGIGIGVNEVEIALDLLDVAALDVILLAGRYTLLEQEALDELLPRCADIGTAVVIGGPYNSGILATGTRGDGPFFHDYAPASDALIDRVRRIEAIADRYGVPLAAAALQFPLAHPQVASVVPGIDSAARARHTVELYHCAIPADFWDALRGAGLLRVDAPTGPHAP